MTRCVRMLACCLSIAVAPGHLASQALPSVTLPPALDRVLRDYERGWRAGQPDSVAALFTADGFALPSGRPPARGRAAIAATYAGPGGDLRLRALAWETSDSLGYIIGAYSYGAGDRDVGKFVLALRRDATGRWMIVADMDNASSRPGPPPTGPSPGQ